MIENLKNSYPKQSTLYWILHIKFQIITLQQYQNSCHLRAVILLSFTQEYTQISYLASQDDQKATEDLHKVNEQIHTLPEMYNSIYHVLFSQCLNISMFLMAAWSSG